jgi:hypothetical protein
MSVETPVTTRSEFFRLTGLLGAGLGLALTLPAWAQTAPAAGTSFQPNIASRCT